MKVKISTTPFWLGRTHCDGITSTLNFWLSKNVAGSVMLSEAIKNWYRKAKNISSCIIKRKYFTGSNQTSWKKLWPLYYIKLHGRLQVVDHVSSLQLYVSRRLFLSQEGYVWCCKSNNRRGLNKTGFGRAVISVISSSKLQTNVK